MTFSFFNHARATSPSDTMNFSEYALKVRLGEWKDQTEQVRKHINNPEEYAEAKKAVPAVTMSGVFKTRKASEIVKHSGLLLMDIDGKDNNPEMMEAFPAKAITDDFILSYHRSVGGKGYAIVFQIDPKRHLAAFASISYYLLTEYGLIVDRACKDVSRMRFVSYDPDLYLNEQAAVWENYDLGQFKEDGRQLKKFEGKRPDLQNTIRIAKEIAQAEPLALDDYERWIKIGFALANGHGEEGREAFHILSRPSEKYDQAACDQKFTSFLMDAEADRVTMGSFYQLAKEVGVDIVKRIEIERADRTPEQALEYIRRKVEESEKLSSDMVFKLVDIYIDSFNLRLNVLTDRLESNGVPLTDSFEDVALHKLRTVIPPSRVKITQVVEATRARGQHRVNPLKDEIDRMANIDSDGVVDQVLDCMVHQDEEMGATMKKYVKKWLISLVASVYGERPELCLVLVGDQGCGKSSFFLNLLPPTLKNYLKSGDFSDGKDNKFVMAEKLILLNDEMTGFHKSDWNRFKALISTEHISERRAYGRRIEDRPRLAVFAGATNDDEFLSDTTGNRRIIPFHMDSLKYFEFLDIDKEAMFSELVSLYLENPEYSWRLTQSEIAELTELSEDNRFKFDDEVLIEQLFAIPSKDTDPKNDYFLSASEIRNVLAFDNSSLRNTQASLIGRTLRRMGFKSDRRRVGGMVKRGFYVNDVKNTIQMQGMTGMSSFSESRGVSPLNVRAV